MSAPKVLVIYPAGRVRPRDDVEWYGDATREDIVNKYFNIGDMVVYDSTLKLLDYSVVRPMKIISPTDSDLDIYRGFDFAVVRASNFVHNEADFGKAVDVLDRIGKPVYAIGVGAQSSDGRPYVLKGESLRFWKKVAETSKVIGVRGTFTAEVFYASGIHNVEVCGCPSIFRARNRDLQIRKPEKVDSLAFSIRREVGSTYSADPASYLRMQRDMLLAADDRYSVTMTSHGEPPEKAFFFKDEAAMQAAEAKLRQIKWFTPETEERLRQIYLERQFFFLKVSDYDQFIRSQDFALGLRVHGVLPAMANAVPGLLISYDTRSAELANTHAIPTLSLEQAAGRDIAELLNQVDYTEFNRLFPVRYDKMKWTMEANGIPHRM